MSRNRIAHNSPCAHISLVFRGMGIPRFFLLDRICQNKARGLVVIRYRYKLLGECTQNPLSLFRTLGNADALESKLGRREALPLFLLLSLPLGLLFL
jgi:hypothetical protein